jgi:hypothetical protein
LDLWAVVHVCSAGIVASASLFETFGRELEFILAPRPEGIVICVLLGSQEKVCDGRR